MSFSLKRSNLREDSGRFHLNVTSALMSHIGPQLYIFALFRLDSWIYFFIYSFFPCESFFQVLVFFTKTWTPDKSARVLFWTHDFGGWSYRCPSDFFSITGHRIFLIFRTRLESLFNQHRQSCLSVSQTRFSYFPPLV